MKITMLSRLLLIGSFHLAACLNSYADSARALPDVEGAHQIKANGGWCWYQGPRAIVTKDGQILFTTIAGESRYSAETEAVARTLDELEGLVTNEGEGVSEVADYLGERRRELFPDGAAESGDEPAGADVETGDGAETGETASDDAASEGRTSQQTLDARGSE